MIVPGDELGDEDRKLVILARGALARSGSASGAAVRDADGRTYAGARVDTATLALTALQVAVATALSSGATGFEAAVLIGGTTDDPGIDTLREISTDTNVFVTDTAGRLIAGEGSR
ncbi:hypothetical protein GOEFS_061_00250 [Gordonia effusa NBRC 100432]|uniref:Cytidine deaminase n=2 Tax=Gordonia effusa TaxID=263908 RepID=H0R0T5_9ACTN|nr:hypothetical protein GOEFS_061_00250 [Gordonia effusa NBRC 100432]